MEQLISRPIKEELSAISGLKRLSSRNTEGYSVVVAEFNLDVDIKWAENEIRTRLSKIRRILPQDIEDPVILRIDPVDQPVLRIALFADLSRAKLYDLAREKVKPKFEQIKNVGAVKIQGGTKREFLIELDRDRLNHNELSTVVIASPIKNFGINVPIGKFEKGASELAVRSLGRYLHALLQLACSWINRLKVCDRGFRAMKR